MARIIFFMALILPVLGMMSPKATELGMMSPKAAEALEKCLEARERKGIELDKDPKGPSMCAGMIYSGSGMHAQATMMFSDALERCVDMIHEEACSRLAASLENLAQTSSDRKEIAQCELRAIDSYTKAIKMHPADSTFAVIRLAQLLISRNQASKALSLCKRHVPLDSQEKRTALKLISASALTRLGHHKEALGLLRELLEEEKSTFNYNNAALAAEKANEGELAESLFIEAMEYNSSHANTVTNYGVWLKDVGRLEAARDMFKNALALDPGERESETSHAKVQLASLTPGGVGTIDTMAKDYVSGLFDGFAPSFEKDLGELRYVAPGIAVRMLLELLLLLPVDARRSRVVFDLGSGTGLFGVELRRAMSKSKSKQNPVKLVGVDLSNRMLAVCETEHPNCYDELYQGDVVQFLREGLEGDKVQAVVSLDVLIYIGEVEALFRGVSERLQKDGLFIFTIEVLSEEQAAIAGEEGGEGKGWRLMEQGRFSHTLEYIITRASQCGFEVVKVDATPIRMQNNNPVLSRTLALRKL